MATIEAYKMNGLGNEFLIIDRRSKNIELSKKKIIELSQKNQVGFDQLIYIEKEINDVTPLIIFNSDGNEVSACGNGSRCIAYLLCMERKIKDISLKTNERILKAKILGTFQVKLDMGQPIFKWEKIPLSKDIDTKNINLSIDNHKFTGGFAINVGNPHIVFFVKDCYDINLKNIGPKIENNNLFPEKCNVTFAQIINKNNILINVWERGAGLTKACGTAACATGVSSYLKGLTDKTVNIKFKEGILKIDFENEQNIFMSGSVSKVKKIKVEI